MKQTIVIIGLGEMGGVFARGFLRAGHPVYPVTRGDNLEQVAREIADPLMVLVAVAENDLHPVLENIPVVWRDRLCLLQNELLPRDWQQHTLDNPTVISVWFEKKKGRDAKVLIPSPVYGLHADIIKSSLESIDIPVNVLASDEDLAYELVRKNVYILTTNIAGLITGGTVRELWETNQELATRVADDVMDIQEWLTGSIVDRPRLIEGMLEAFEGDPEHNCMGRSAPARLARALSQADAAALPVETLREISQKTAV